MTSPSGVAERLFRLALLAFPRSFRARHGDEMLRMFRLQWESRRAAGAPSRMAFLASAMVDAAASGVAHRISGAASPDGLLAGRLSTLGLAARTLIRRPLFALLAVTTLAVGVGSVTAMASVVRHVLLAPLPYAGGESIVVLWQNGKISLEDMPDRLGAVPAEIRTFRDDGRTHRALTWFDRTVEKATLVLPDGSQSVEVGLVGPGFFDFLGVEPALGRLFAPGDGPAGSDVVVLAHGEWERRFGADPGVVGRSLEIDGAQRTVVGVLPEGFRWIARQEPVEYWLPRPLEGAPRRWVYTVLAKPAPGADMETLRREFATHVWADHTAGGDPGRLSLARLDEEHAATAATLRETLLGPVEPAIHLLTAFVSLVLLLACLSVSQLLAGRFAERERELVIRAALGAGRGRLGGLVAGESTVIGLAGGTAGLALGGWGLELIRRTAPVGVPRLETATLSPGVVATALGATVLVTVALGFLPALRAGRVNASRAVTSTRARTGRRTAIGRRSLVFAQVCFGTVLFVGALLLLRSLRSLESQELGFRPAGVLAGSFRLPPELWRTAAMENVATGEVQERRTPSPELADRLARLEAGLETLPGVEAAGMSRFIPLSGGYGWWTPFTPEGWEERASDEMAGGVAANWVDPGFFRVLEIRPRRGRLIRERDMADAAPWVGVINESAAARFWPNRDAVGQRFQYWGGRFLGEGRYRPGPHWVEVVGIVPDLRERAYREAEPTVYLPLRPGEFAEVSFVVAAHGEARDGLPPGLGPRAREVFNEVFPTVGLEDFERLERTVDRWLATPRFYSWLVTVFAFYSFGLALVGIVGVVAYQVSLRDREVAVRRALGARSPDILSLLTAETARTAAAAVVVGLALSAAGAGLLERWLYGVQPLDPATFVATPLAFMAGAVGAALLVARRALRTEPWDALAT